MVTLQHPGELGGGCCAAQFQQRQYCPLQKSNTRETSTGFQRPNPEDCNLQSNRHQVRSEADAVLSASKHSVAKSKDIETSPLLLGLLTGKPPTAKYFSCLPGKPEANMEHQHPSGSSNTPVHNSFGAKARSPPSLPPIFSNEEIVGFIRKRVALLRAKRGQSDHNRQNLTCTAFHSTTFVADGRDVPVQVCDSAVPEQSTRAFQENRLKSKKRNSKLTSKSNNNDHKSAAMRPSKGTSTLSVEHAKSFPNEHVDSCATETLAVPVQTCSNANNSKLVNLEYCKDKECIYENGHDRFKYMMNGHSHFHYSLNALKELITAMEKVETISQVDNFIDVLLQKYWNGERDNIYLFASTEYPKIMFDVAATCQKQEEQSPVVLTTQEPLLSTEEEQNYSNVKGKVPFKYPQLNVLTSPERVPQEEKGEACMKPVSKGNVQSTTNLPAFERLQSCHATSKEGASQSKPKFTRDEVCVQNGDSTTLAQGKRLMSHTTSSHSFGKNAKVRSPDPHSPSKRPPSVAVVKDPQYEDISDVENIVQPEIQQSSTEPQDLDFAPHFGNITEDKKTANTAEETPSLPTQGFKPNILQSGPEDQMKMISSDKLDPETVQTCSCPYLVETDTGFEMVLCPKCASEQHLEGQINASQSPSALADEESDDEWVAVPVHMCGIVLADGEQGEDIKDATSGHHLKPASPEPGSACPPQEVPDTTQHYPPLRTAQSENCSEDTKDETLLGMETHTSQNFNRSGYESDTSCDTEDSCDYAPYPERNYLTVSRQALNLAAPSASEENGPNSVKVKEEKVELQRLKSPSRLKVATKKHKSNMDSDKDDENCDKQAKMTKKKRVSFSHLVPSSSPVIEIVTGTETETDVCEDRLKIANNRSTSSSESQCADISPRVQQKRDSKETVQEVKLHCQSELKEEQSEEVQTVSPEPSYSKKTKAAEATAEMAHAQQKNKPMGSKGNTEPPKAKKDVMSESAKVTAKRVHIDSSETEDSEDWFSDASSSPHAKYMKSGKLTEAGARPELALQKYNSQIASKGCQDSKNPLQKSHLKKLKKTRHRSSMTGKSTSDSSDSDSAQRKPKKDRMPHKKPQKEQSQSAESNAPHSVPSHVVPRLYIEKSSHSTKHLKLSQQSPVHREADDRKTRVGANTPATTSTKCQLMKGQMRHSNRDEPRKLVSKPNTSTNSPPAVQEPKSKPSSSGPKQPSLAPKSRLSHYHSQPPTSDSPSTPARNCPSATPSTSSALRKVRQMWGDGFHPIHRPRKASVEMADNPRTKNVKRRRETIPGPSNSAKQPRQKHSSSKSETPLMKRTRSEAKERTRDINFNPPRQQIGHVADHYKWRNRGDGSQPQGSHRRRRRYSSPPSLDNWE